MTDASFAWIPSEADKASRNWTRLIRAAGAADYDDLAARAARDQAWYWDQAIRFLDVGFYQPYATVLDRTKGVPWPQWCQGGTTNLVLNCLDRHLGIRPEHPAVEWEAEDGARR